MSDDTLTLTTRYTGEAPPSRVILDGGEGYSFSLDGRPVTDGRCAACGGAVDLRRWSLRCDCGGTRVEALHEGQVVGIVSAVPVVGARSRLTGNRAQRRARRDR